MPLAEIVAVEASEAAEAEVPVGPGRTRGLILHKLMEEVLTGEIVEDVKSLAARAEALIVELAVDRSGEGPVPSTDEIAATASRTLRLPEIAALRPALVPELPLYAMLHAESGQTALRAARMPSLLRTGGPRLYWIGKAISPRRTKTFGCMRGSFSTI